MTVGSQQSAPRPTPEDRLAALARLEARGGENVSLAVAPNAMGAVVAQSTGAVLGEAIAQTLKARKGDGPTLDTNALAAAPSAANTPKGKEAATAQL